MRHFRVFMCVCWMVCALVLSGCKIATSYHRVVTVEKDGQGNIVKILDVETVTQEREESRIPFAYIGKN